MSNLAEYTVTVEDTQEADALLVALTPLLSGQRLLPVWIASVCLLELARVLGDMPMGEADQTTSNLLMNLRLSDPGDEKIRARLGIKR